MLTFPKTLYQRFFEYAKQGSPNESCALLGGVKNGADAAVTQVYLMRNVDESPEHFSMNPKEQFEAVKDMRKNGWVLLGNLHSHPASPSRPSEEDKRLAFDPSLRYLILSLMEKEPVVNCFHIREDGVEKEPISFGEE